MSAEKGLTPEDLAAALDTLETAECLPLYEATALLRWRKAKAS
jgi:hypothetical protein